MELYNGFTKMTPTEFCSWVTKQSVSRSISKIQLHHTWSPRYAQFTGNNHFSMQAGMKSYHMSIGYTNIAQNFTIFPDGYILTGRPMNSAPAGIVGCNTHGICIENIGNFDEDCDTMTQKQKDAIVIVTAALLKRFGLSAENGVTYHGWWTANGTYIGTYDNERSCKTCPGTRFFGGNTMASYKKNLMPLIKQAMAGTYGKVVDDEVVTKKPIFNCSTKKSVTCEVIEKNDANYIKLRNITDLGGKVGYDAVKKLPSVDLAPEQDTKVVINGKTVDARAVFARSTNYIAIRDILEMLGVPKDAITWNKTTRTITVNGDLKVEYTKK